MDVQKWLSSQGLQQYAAAFAAERIDEVALRSLTDDDLKLLGVAALGDRKRLLAAIAALPQATASHDEAALLGMVDRWPSVLARPLKEYLDEADPRIKLWAACDLVELTLRFLVMVRVAEEAGRGEVPAQLAEALAQRIEQPTLGKWRGMAEALLKAADPGSTVAPEARAYLFEVLVPLLDGSTTPPTVEGSLKRLRNALAHGGGLTKAKATHLLEVWKSPFEAAMARAGWLGELSLLVRDGGDRWGELRGLSMQPTPTTGPLVAPDMPTASGLYVARGDRSLALWPLGLYGPPRTAASDAPETEPAPQVYTRRGEVHLEYTPLGEASDCESIGDSSALEAFRRIFQIDRLRAGAASAGFTVRGFEAEMRRDSDRLVGRQEVIETLERAVQETAHGVIWLSGPAGVGKSFVVARVATDLLEEASDHRLLLPYRFRVGDDRCSRESFLRFALERLGSWLGQESSDDERPALQRDRTAPLDRLKETLATVPRDRQALFILDGLDELAALDPDFAHEVPLAVRQHNVTWMCCGRPQGGLQEMFRRAQSIEPFPDGLPRMSEGDIREMLLEKLGPLRKRLLRGDRDEGDRVVNRFVERVAKNADGLPIYVKYVVGDVLNGLISPDAPGQLPPSLARYHEELLRRLQVGDLHDVLTPLAVTLAVAREPLTTAEIAALLARRARVTSDATGVALVSRALSAIESMVRLAPDPDGGEGYTLWHQSLREHMLSSADVSMSIRLARQAFADGALRPAGDEAERYLYRQGIGHLLEEGRREEALELMTGPEYVRGRLAALPATQGEPGLAKDWCTWLIPSERPEELEAAAASFGLRLDGLCEAARVATDGRDGKRLQRLLLWKLEPRLADRLGGGAALRRVLPSLLSLGEELERRAPDNARCLRDLSISYNRLGDLALRTDVAQARGWFEKHRAIAERLAKLEPDNVTYLHDLSIHYDRLGDLALRTDVAQARGWFEQGLAITERLAKLKPDNVRYLLDLSTTYDRLGDLALRTDVAQARGWFEKALTIRERLAKLEPDNVTCQRDLSSSYERLGDLALRTDVAQARGWFEKALTIRERLAKLEPDNVTRQRDLSGSYNRLGDLALRTDVAQARGWFEKGLAIAERLAKLEPDNVRYLLDLSTFYERLGDLALRTDVAQARGWFEKCLAIAERLANLEPDNVTCQRDLSISYNRLGDLALRTDVAQARGWFEKCLAIAERLAKLEPDNVTCQRDLSISYERLGDLALRTDVAQARGWFEKGLAIAEWLAKLEPDNVSYLLDLSISYDRLGDLALRTDVAQARGWLEKGLAIAERLAKLEPDNVTYLRDLGFSYNQLGDLAVRTDVAQARAWFEKGLATRERLLSLKPDSMAFQRDLSIAVFNLGWFEARHGGGDPGPWFEQAIALRRALVERHPDDADLWERLARACYERMAQALRQRGTEEARPLAEECAAALDRASTLAPQRPSVPYLRACILALTDDADSALEALARAVELGWDDADEALDEPDFAGLRDLPRFQELIEAMRQRRSSAAS
jgi:hypothetical protein